jgi:hypothetical protein
MRRYRNKRISDNNSNMNLYQANLIGSDVFKKLPDDERDMQQTLK